MEKLQKNIVFLDSKGNKIPEKKIRRYKNIFIGIENKNKILNTGLKKNTRNVNKVKRLENNILSDIKKQLTPKKQKIVPVVISNRTGKPVKYPKKNLKYKIGFYNNKTDKFFVPEQKKAKVSKSKLTRLKSSLKNAKGNTLLINKNKYGQIANFDKRSKYKQEIWKGDKLEKSLTKNAFKLDVVEQIKQEALNHRIKPFKKYELKTSGESYAESLNKYFLDLPELIFDNAYTVNIQCEINTPNGKQVLFPKVIEGESGYTFSDSASMIKKTIAQRLVQATRKMGYTFTSLKTIKSYMSKDKRSKEEIESKLKQLSKLDELIDKNILLTVSIVGT